MKKKIKVLLSIFLLLLLSFSIIGCSNSENNEKEVKVEKEISESVENREEDSHYPVVITTYNYSKEPVEMVFEKSPERVVAIYQSSIETLLALGQGDKIVAAAFLDTPVKAEFKESFKSIKYYKKRPTKEEILGMEPDFITSWHSLFSDKVYGDIDFWNDRDINTYVQQNSGVKIPNSLENEYQDIINMGKIFNVEQKAISIVEDMKNKIEEAKEYVKNKEKVNTVILEMNKEGQFRIYGEDSIGGDIATQVGANLVANKNAQIGLEDLIKLNPDVIFTVYYGDKIDREKAISNIMDNSALGSILAVKNNRVYPIVLSEVYASGIRTLDGIETIIDGIYPDLKGN